MLARRLPLQPSKYVTIVGAHNLFTMKITRISNHNASLVQGVQLVQYPGACANTIKDDTTKLNLVSIFVKLFSQELGLTTRINDSIAYCKQDVWHQQGKKPI